MSCIALGKDIFGTNKKLYIYRNAAMLHQTQFKTSFKGRLNKPQWRTFMQPISAFQPPETTKLQSYPLKNPSLRMLITTSPFETKIQGWNGNPKNVQEEVHLASCLQSSIIGPCFFGTKNVCLCVCVTVYLIPQRSNDKSWSPSPFPPKPSRWLHLDHSIRSEIIRCRPLCAGNLDKCFTASEIWR